MYPCALLLVRWRFYWWTKSYSTDGAFICRTTLSTVLKGSPSGDSVVLQGDVNAPVGKDSEAWRGVIRIRRLPDLNLNGVLYSVLMCKPQFVHNGHNV